MDIMALWTTLDDLEGANTKRNYKNRDGESLVKKQISAAVWIVLLLQSSGIRPQK